MTEAVFDLDREAKLEANIDALGKKWEVKQRRGRALYITRPNPDRIDAVIPKEMEGEWTNTTLLTAQIQKYVQSSWHQADQADLKAERKRAAALEAAKVAKEAKKKNDSGNAKPKKLLSA